MSWPKLDTTVNLGHVLTIVTILLTAVGAYNGMILRLSAAELKIQTLEAQQTQLYLVVKDIAVLQRDVAVIKDRIERGAPVR